MASGSRCHTADYLKKMKVVDSSVPCLSSSLLKSHTVSTNIKSDSVHCDPSSCVASGSRCHTADYLNVMNGVDAMIPCLMYSHSKPPPPGSMCSPSPVQTPLSAHSVHLMLLLMLIVPLFSSPSSPCKKKTPQTGSAPSRNGCPPQSGENVQCRNRF